MYSYNDELYHFGVKGMKWGVRRFESKSGGLTPAGKKRYAEGKGPTKKEVKAKVKEMKAKGTAPHNTPKAEAFVKNSPLLLGSMGVTALGLGTGKLTIAMGASFVTNVAAGITLGELYLNNKANKAAAREELNKNR